MKRLLPPILLVITWATIIFANSFVPIGYTLPAQWSYVGIPIAVLGILISFAGARMFKAEETNIMTFDKPDKLVTTGLFAWSRNLMYLGFALCALGGAVAMRTVSPLIISGVFCIVLDRWYVRFEEAMMHATFSADYASYCEQVRRWV